MKRLATAIAVIALVGTPALAADLAKPVYKSPPPAPLVPVFSWTGCYVGGNVGAAINDSSYTLSPTGQFLTNPGFTPTNPLRTDSADFRESSFTGGGQVGCNWQNGVWVWGLETDLNFKGENQTDNVSRVLAAPLAGNFNHSTVRCVRVWGEHLPR